MSIKKELMLELKSIYDDEDFVCSTIDISKTEDSWNTILDYIKTSKKQGDEITSDDIQLIAIKLRNEEDANNRKIAKQRVASVIL